MEIYYTFDIGSVFGFAVANTGKNRFTATLMNGASISTSDYAFGASSVQLVSANSQFVKMPPYTFSTQGMSFACWFRSDSSGSYSRVFEFGSGGDDYIIMYINNGMLSLYIGAEQISTVSVNDNVWRHVAWTIDVSGNWVLYVNGVDVWDLVGGYPTNVVRTRNFLGYSYLDTNPYFNGAIDDFRVYNGYVLSATEVSNLYYGMSLL